MSIGLLLPDEDDAGLFFAVRFSLKVDLLRMPNAEWGMPNRRMRCKHHLFGI
jgi:hypothetical protein